MAVKAKQKKESSTPGLKQEKEQTVSVQEVVKDERTHKISGFSLLVLSILLLIALGSYCFTWQEDQDKVFKAGADFLFVDNLQVDNMLGRLGAWTGHTLIYKGFGLAAFLLCTLPFVAGVNLIFGKKLFSVWRNVKYTFTGLVFFSVALAFALPDSGFSYGGAVGEFCSQYLSNLLGKAGTGLLLFVAGFSWFIWRFNPVFKLPKRLEKPTLTDADANLTKPEAVAAVVPEAVEEPAIAATPAAQSDARFQPTPVPSGKSINDIYAEGKTPTMQVFVPEEINPLTNQPVAANGNSMDGDGIAVVLPQSSTPVNDDPVNALDVMETDESVETIAVALPPKPNPPAPVADSEPEPEPVQPKKITPIAVREILPNQLPKSDLELELNNDLDEEEDIDEMVANATGSIPEITQDLEPYDPSLDLKGYKFPGLDLLDTHGSEKVIADPEELEQNKNQIIGTLKNYDITIQRISATVGPTVTLYEIVPAPGVRISRIKNLEDDIALSLAALGIRIIAPIPGKGTIGIEVPNVRKNVVSMKSLLSSDKYLNNKYSLPIAIGKTIANEHFVADLASMPHLLMAGATGQGKSVGINTVLVSLLYKKHPSQLKFVLVDPKKVELSLYRVIEKHFLAKLPGEDESIITDTKKVINTLNALCIEMDNRYDLLKEAHVRNIKEYNEKFIKRKLNPQKGHQYLPFIVLVVDEFADLIMTAGKEVEMPIARLAQLARAVGIHLIIATQRPSVNIITGTIKANFPSRIAFKVSSKIDSRTILDAGGAEQLIGKGDMLISHNGELIRLQCAFVDTPEVEKVCEFIGTQRGYPDAFLLPEYVDEKEQEGRDFDLSDRDVLFADAARLIVQNQMGSTSLIQRRMKLGYNRAGRLMDQLEAAGIVGANQGSKAREVLVKTEHELEQILENF
ncbi:DNA translocase FtsK 4TM domain-containing protein [Phnomibacter sp. MR]|uniref:FtsK/SpoIIIE family DNA translocase n=1 Tax=Phnomibacter sp. MR TaxID=3042318 RepID=UPI003A8001CE